MEVVVWCSRPKPVNYFNGGVTMRGVSRRNLAVLIVSAFFLLTTVPVFANTIQIRFSSIFPVQQVITKQIIIPWIDKINKESGGKVKITLYPSGALGKPNAQIDLVTKGIADMTYHLADYTPGRFPLTTVFSLPFIPPSGQKVSEAMWKTFEKEPAYQKEYSDFKVLALFGHSGGHFYTVKKPIQTIADFKGMKIRSANPAISKALTLWGAVPIDQPITETYQAMQLGVIDGTVLVWEGMQVFKLNEVAKYATQADLYTMPMMIVMNKNTWNKLPKDVQDLIDSTTGLQMSSEAGLAFDEAEKPFKKMALDRGMKEYTFSPEEYKKFTESTLPLRDEWVAEMNQKGYPAKQVLNTVLGFVEK